MFAIIYCRYLAPFSSIPQYFNESLSIKACCRRPKDRDCRPLVPIGLSSNFNCFKTLNAEPIVFPMYSHPIAVI
jgi:hypothetical protein